VEHDADGGVPGSGVAPALPSPVRGSYGDNPIAGGTLTTDEYGASAGDRTSAAARLLEVATNNADELLAEARVEATAIVAAAHAEAERVRAELEKAQAERNAEFDRQRTTVLADLADLAERQAALEAEVARLQELEHANRDQMRNYLTQQLAQIEENANPQLRGMPRAGLSG